MPKFSNRDFPPLPSEMDGRRSQRLKDKAAKERQTCAFDTLATINDLPDELLLEILYYLPGIDLEHFQLEALVNLSITNRRFHRLAAEKLYLLYSSYFCEPYLFLRTMITHPHLAKLVQHADLTYGSFAHCERERHTATAQDKKIVKEGLKELGIPDWKTWATGCNTRLADLDLLHTTILMHTHNINTLSINHSRAGDYMGNQTPKWIDLFRRANFGTKISRMQRFENLRTLRIDVLESISGDIAPIFRTPSLRVLTLKGLLEYGKGDELAIKSLQKRIPPRCNNLEELHLERGFIQTDILGIIFASARGLKLFRHQLTLEYLDIQLDNETDVGITKLISILAFQKTTLESLSFASDSDVEIRFRSVFNLYEGLRNFPVLKHLSCPLGSIVDARLMISSALLAEKLPASLETFDVTICKHSDNQDVDSLPNFEQLAAMCSSHTPQLKKIRVSIDTPGSWLEYDWAGLVEPFSRTGVDLVIEQVEEDDDDGFSEVYESAPRTFIDVDALFSDSSRSSDEVSLYSN